ncbi:efflux transporter outer membrane subunit [Sphingomonas sp.]|jgi:NodT family efflux transporter outer membrane factor (OMF) lipoprotein|uniref:efflux transporter outer membrane subunit n=1 Tax=Sphingomonas sp. TaxID=28214 RepID=UPI002603C71C|nr:efflux transporter outer membrane subunit [Sphingomonas sp.]MDF2604667.1 TolC family protein [Sphingomonas sp.]
MRSSALLCLLLLGACTVGPDYKGPPAVGADAGARGQFVRGNEAAVPAPGVARWWETLGDATLDRLVDDALANSPSIAAAEARIRQAQAQARQQRANQAPSISANGTYLRAQLPGIDLADDSGGSAGGGSGSESNGLDFYNLGLNASWEPDLVGGVRRGIEQSRAAVGQRYADLADAQVSLTAQVAQAYVNYRDAQERIALNARSSELQRQSLALMEQRLAAGTVSALQVERLKTDLESTEAQAIPLTAQADEYRDVLALLTGRTPGALDATLAAPVPVPLPPAKVAVGDPAALIASRPDIRAAERALAASTAAIGVNEAKRYPAIRFMGILGMGGTSPGDVLDPGNLTTLLAPQISWSFLDFGRTAAAVRQSEAQRDEAEANYRQTVLAALQDAETSLSRFAATRRQLARLASAEQSASRAAALNRQRVEAGTSTLIDQLDVERQRLSAAMAVAQAKAQLTNSFVAVNKALGLGWTPVAGGEQPDG